MLVVSMVVGAKRFLGCSGAVFEALASRCTVHAVVHNHEAVIVHVPTRRIGIKHGSPIADTGGVVPWLDHSGGDRHDIISKFCRPLSHLCHQYPITTTTVE